ncbi:MAG UNVERIFIED_CONTAM: hypothetical protein LVT10_04805 [Anaerolineae bacterium]
MELDRSQLIIIDLEASCWRKNPPDGQESEIIEIGICPFELATASPLHKRSLLVKPIRSENQRFLHQVNHVDTSSSGWWDIV